MIFRRARTLKNYLAPSKFQLKNVASKMPIRKGKLGSFKCQNKRCLCCATISHNKKTFKSNNTGESFEIKQSLNCDSTHVIYILECTCSLQYVGRTKQTLRARLNKHRFNITHSFQQHSVSRHAAQIHECKMDQFCITPIEQIDVNTTNRVQKLSQREMYWIFKLNTMIPIGLNESLENVF